MNAVAEGFTRKSVSAVRDSSVNSSCLVVSYVRNHCLVVVLSQLLFQGFLEFLHNHGSLQSLLLSLYTFSLHII